MVMSFSVLLDTILGDVTLLLRVTGGSHHYGGGVRLDAHRHVSSPLLWGHPYMDP